MSVTINASTSTGLVQSADTSGEIELQSNGTTALKVNTNEGIQILNCLGVGNATPSTSGAGITFPATQSASTDANTLDDYEEGTFTPTIRGSSTAGTGTYSTQNGTYIKIGRSVTVFGYIRWSAHTGTGAMQISNLPFTSFNGGDNYSVAPIFLQNIALTASNYAQAVQVPNSTQIDLYQYPTGGGSTTTMPMDTSAEIGFSATYLATA